ncbi:MAG: ribosome maturation factor RimP [Leptospiraceae bacterium]|nr:ribosome maturation factor RimP [Leptospiraceae bacterium]
MKISEPIINEMLIGILEKPIVLYSLKLTTKNNHSLIEVNLDNLENLHGSVTLDDCELVSQKLMKELDSQFLDADYTLYVSSAGAERALRIPEDLERFKTLPLRLFFKDAEGKLKNEVLKILTLDETSLEVEVYHGKKKKKKEIFSLGIKDLVKGNLFLDL